MMEDESKISVVIPYHNKWPRTKYLIESLNRQDIDRELFHVIMVDDGSDLPLEQLLKSCKVKFELEVMYRENGGRSAARNFGFKQAMGDIIVFIDDDIILPPDFLTRHYNVHTTREENVFVHGGIYDLIELTPYYDPETGEQFAFLDTNANPRIDRTSLLSFERVFDEWKEFKRKKRLSRLEKLIWHVLSTRELSSLHWIGCVGGDLSVRRSVLEKTGGFDENFQVWGEEDFELGYRLIKQGVMAVYDSECFVYHITHAHKGHFDKRRISGNYFSNKHKDTNINLLYSFLEMEIGMEEFIEKAMR